MQIAVSDIMQALPPLKGQRDVIVSGEQSVADIMTEVLNSHKEFAADYDTIVDFFNTADPLVTLFNFCKDNLPYRAEDEKDQTSRSPIAILMLADNWGVDCKHYSGFIAGTIDALNRAGYTNYDWTYRFVSYDPFYSLKEHVFVVVDPGGNEIWIDPAPIEKGDGSYKERTFNDRKVIPFYKEDKKPRQMSLNRISGCCINPYYQAMGYISIFQPATDDQYTAVIDTSVRDLYHIGFDPVTGQVDDPVAAALDPISLGPSTLSPTTVSYDPGVPTYDPGSVTPIETTSFPFIADYPTVTGETQTIPGTTGLNDQPPPPTNSTSGLNVGFSFKDFIEANPVETILIGSAVVVGGIWLIARHKKKKKQRQRA